jgi:excisionase family DNA binding protein
MHSSNLADDADAYSVDEFCSRHRISTQLFYKLKPQGLMPATFTVGSRVLISREAAAAWRRARENAAAAEKAA